MNRLIRTPTRRLIEVVPQIHIQLLSRAHIPRALVRPVHARHTPLQVVAAKRKCAIRVLGLGKRHGKRHIVDGALLGDIRVEQLDGRAGCGYELHELAGYDLELAGGRVVA